MTSSTAPDIGTSTQVYRIFIRATPQAIWDAITKPEWTQRWGSGFSATSRRGLRTATPCRGNAPASAGGVMTL